MCLPDCATVNVNVLSFAGVVQELEAVHAEKKAVYDAAVGGLEGVVSKLQSSVTDLQKDVEAASSDLSKTRSRVQDLEGHVQRMQAMGADELKRRSVSATWGVWVGVGWGGGVSAGTARPACQAVGPFKIC